MHFDEKFWLAVAFFTFVALMAKYVWPIIAKSLDAGSKKIAEEILAAQEMKKEAEKLLAKAEKIPKKKVPAPTINTPFFLVTPVSSIKLVAQTSMKATADVIAVKTKRTKNRVESRVDPGNLANKNGTV